MLREQYSRYWSVSEPGKIVAGVRQIPALAPGWSVICVRKLGVCGTDYNAFLGQQPFISYPRILGHEIAGEIVRTTDKSGSLRVGDRVAVIPYIHCHKCIACRAGKTNCCANLEVIGVHRDGAMQQFIEVPNENLIVSNDLPLNHLAVVEPLSIGTHAVSRAGVQADEVVIVSGSGPIGIGIMLMAKQQGASVIGMDIDEHRLHFCRSELNLASYSIHALKDPLTEVEKITGGEMATAVFDATGNRTAMEQAVKFLAHGGRYILVGLTRENISFAHPYLHAREITIHCSRNATRNDFLEVIQTLKAGHLSVEKYISHHMSFEQVGREFPEHVKDRGHNIKVVIDLP